MSMVHIKRAFELFDLNHDGTIDEEEFRYAMHFMGVSEHISNLTLSEVNNNFHKFDFDQNGIISLKGWSSLNYMRVHTTKLFF